MVATTLLAAGAAIALLTNPPSADPPRRQTAQRPAQAPPLAPPATPAPTPEPTTPPPASEETQADGEQVTRADIAATKRAARQFLRGYLAYTHGLAGAAQILAATSELRRALAVAPPRVPARERRRRARILTLQVNGAGAEHVGLLALIDDDRRTYTIVLRLTVLLADLVDAGDGGSAAGG